MKQVSLGGLEDFPGPARRPRCSSMSEKKSRRSMSEKKSRRPFGKIKFFYPNGRWWHVPGNL